MSEVCFSQAIAAGWIQLDKNTVKPLVTREIDLIEDKVKESSVQHLKGQLQKSMTWNIS